MRLLHNLTIKDTDTFNKAVKTLKKRFRSIDQDWLAFVNSIQTDEDLGICLGEGWRRESVPLLFFIPFMIPEQSKRKSCIVAVKSNYTGFIFNLFWDIIYFISSQSDGLSHQSIVRWRCRR